MKTTGCNQQCSDCKKIDICLNAEMYFKTKKEALLRRKINREKGFKSHYFHYNFSDGYKYLVWIEDLGVI